MDLAKRFEESTPHEASALLDEDPEAAAMLKTYLADFGDRCIEELKLESRTMTDDPAFCLAMLQNQVRLMRSGAMPDREAQGEVACPSKALAAEATVVEKLQGRRGKFGIPLLTLYRFVLKNARAGIRNRENQRLARTRAFSVVRQMFRAIGSRFATDGRLDSTTDIFFVELEELEMAAAGEPMELRSLVSKRKARYETWRRQPPLPDRFETSGITGPDGEPSLVAPEQDSGPFPEGALTGLGAYPGIVESPAIVLMTPDPTVRLDGQILVTRQTDPGWVLLFHGISGLVVERGSMLSHSAIVAREMRIPTVVGVAGAPTRITTGDRLRLDGGAGTVEILVPKEVPGMKIALLCQEEPVLLGPFLQTVIRERPEAVCAVFVAGNRGAGENTQTFAQRLEAQRIFWNLLEPRGYLFALVLKLRAALMGSRDPRSVAGLARRMGIPVHKVGNPNEPSVSRAFATGRPGRGSQPVGIAVEGRGFVNSPVGIHQPPRLDASPLPRPAGRILEPRRRAARVWGDHSPGGRGVGYR